jgi:DNA-directed RNA polymerase subunit RPC12/RpoP
MDNLRKIATEMGLPDLFPPDDPYAKITKSNKQSTCSRCKQKFFKHELKKIQSAILCPSCRGRF